MRCADALEGDALREIDGKFRQQQVKACRSWQPETVGYRIHVQPKFKPLVDRSGIDAIGPDRRYAALLQYVCNMRGQRTRDGRVPIDAPDPLLPLVTMAFASTSPIRNE